MRVEERSTKHLTCAPQNYPCCGKQCHCEAGGDPVDTAAVREHLPGLGPEQEQDRSAQVGAI